jgi:hypothetical protein
VEHFRDKSGDAVDCALYVESACGQADRVIEKDGREAIDLACRQARPDGEIYHLSRGQPDLNDRGQPDLNERGRPDRNNRGKIFHIFHRSGLKDEWSNITVFTTVPLEGWRRASTSTVEDVRRLAGRPRAFSIL